MDLLPRISLSHLPTPLEPATTLQREVGAKPRLFIKRDDCTGLAMGGNKTRKLEFSLADANRRQADVIITSGGLQSNHVRQTAAAAAKLGLEFIGVVSNPLQKSSYRPSHIYSETGNLLLDNWFGGRLVVTEETESQATIDELVCQEKAAGKQPYVIPVGASDGIGAMGYADCAAELLDQISQLGLESTHLVLATGSCGTQAGLLAGLRALGSAIEVIGISVSEPAPRKIEKVKTVIAQMNQLWPDPVSLSDDEIRVLDQFVGDGYAVPTSGCRDAIDLLARTEGVLLDPVYTGKAMDGLLNLLATAALDAARDVIFLHTGGSPALFAYPDLLAHRVPAGQTVD